MRNKKETLIICILIPLAVGAISSLLSGSGMAAFDQLNKPALSPPGVLFPIVWTILYTLMGIASYLILESNAALTSYGLQLFVNFFWSIFFFRLEWFLFSFFWLILLWLLILICIVLFQRTSKAAALLMVPYALWVSFAGYLNLSIYLLN